MKQLRGCPIRRIFRVYKCACPNVFFTCFSMISLFFTFAVLFFLTENTQLPYLLPLPYLFSFVFLLLYLAYRFCESGGKKERGKEILKTLFNEDIQNTKKKKKKKKRKSFYFDSWDLFLPLFSSFLNFFYFLNHHESLELCCETKSALAAEIFLKSWSLRLCKNSIYTFVLKELDLKKKEGRKIKKRLKRKREREKR